MSIARFVGGLARTTRARIGEIKKVTDVEEYPANEVVAPTYCGANCCNQLYHFIASFIPEQIINVHFHA